jgi:hypothetical protein
MKTLGSLTAHSRKYLCISIRSARWSEYAEHLRAALRAGYQLVSLEDWLARPELFQERTLVLRHDVDLNASSAWRISQIEKVLGLKSTFYFRWTTLDLSVIDRIRENGSHVGLHYETLTRYAIENRLRTSGAITSDVLGTCRQMLKEEIARFKSLVGICNSVAAHGDRRAHLIGHRNDELLKEQRPGDYGILFNADDPKIVERLMCWVSDGDGAPQYWSAGISLPDAIASGHHLILFNTHPNHWGAGIPLMAKRVIAHLGFVIRHPWSLEWGKPEVSAWRHFQLSYDRDTAPYR